MKLKTKITHSFDIEENLMNNMDFSMSSGDIKKKTKIVEVKKKNKLKTDVSTRLF